MLLFTYKAFYRLFFLILKFTLQSQEIKVKKIKKDETIVSTFQARKKDLKNQVFDSLFYGKAYQAIPSSCHPKLTRTSRSCLSVV